MPKRNLLIQSGLVITPTASTVADLFLEDGRIAAVASPSTLAKDRLVGSVIAGLTVVDALGKFIVPAVTALVPPHGDATAPVPAVLPRSGFACELLPAGSSPVCGNWLPVWYPSPEIVARNQLEALLAERVWGLGMPVVGLLARQHEREADAPGWLATLSALAAEAGVLVVMWLHRWSRRQLLQAARHFTSRGARLLLAAEHAADAVAACSLAAKLGEGARAGVAVACPPPASDSHVSAAAWWQLVSAGAIRCLVVQGGAEIVARLYSEGVASGRVSQACFADLLATWLRRQAGLSPPLGVDSAADLVVLDPEAQELRAAEQTWIGGVTLADASFRQEAGRPLAWPL